MACHTDFLIHKLSEEALTLLAQIDASCNNFHEDTHRNTLLSSLINDAKARYQSLNACQNTNMQNANMKYDEFNDFFDNIIEKSKDIAEGENNRKDISDTVVKGFDDGYLNENTLAIDVTHSKNVEVYKYEKIAAAWNKQLTVADRRHFIADLANSASFSILSSRILLPLLLSDEFFLETVEMLRDVVRCIPQEFINKIFLSLFKEKGPEITKGSYLTDLLSSMTDSQRNKLMCNFLDEISINMEGYHISIVYMLIETADLTNDTIQMLLERLLANIELISNNRCFGNLLLLIAQRLSTQSPQNIINLMLLLCNQFKGVMRIRIKNILSTIADARGKEREKEGIVF